MNLYNNDFNILYSKRFSELSNSKFNFNPNILFILSLLITFYSSYLQNYYKIFISIISYILIVAIAYNITRRYTIITKLLLYIASISVLHSIFNIQIIAIVFMIYTILIKKYNSSIYLLLSCFGGNFGQIIFWSYNYHINILLNKDIDTWLLIIPFNSLVFELLDKNSFGISEILLLITIINMIYVTYKLKLPLLKTQITIYCCGVFDLCHIGHMEFFRKCAELGNVLLVGICNDHDVQTYKRQPFMTTQIRADTVKACKYVDNVIINAPLITTKEFMNKYNIDYVVLTEEYNNKKDIYYKEPRELNKTIVIKYMDNISTTSIVKTIQSRGFDINIQKLS